MIKFFRKIRYDLMEKNKTGKYLKYAIGEIILVIIGILIALSINNWNENRKLKIEEQNSLKDLRTEIVSNIEALSSAIESNHKSYNLGQKFIKLLDDREAFDVMPDSVFRSDYLSMVYSISTFDPIMGILNSMISSGKINNISNKELLYSLSSLNDLIIDALEDQKKIELNLDRFVEKIYTSSNVIINGQNQGVNFNLYYDNPWFRLLIRRYLVAIRESGLNEEAKLLDQFKHILELIDKEIVK